MVKWENIYCRGPIAEMFNNIEHSKWISNPNLMFPAGNRPGKAVYESGKPDGFVFDSGRVACVECKYDEGSLYMGDPEDQEAKNGWHYHQRSWYRNVAIPTGVPYYIAAYVYPERNPKRRPKEKAFLFLVPAWEWLCLEEELAGRKTIALTPELERIHANKSLTLLPRWGKYLLEYRAGGFHIPENRNIFQY